MSKWVKDHTANKLIKIFNIKDYNDDLELSRLLSELMLSKHHVTIVYDNSHVSCNEILIEVEKCYISFMYSYNKNIDFDTVKFYNKHEFNWFIYTVNLDIGVINSYFKSEWLGNMDNTPYDDDEIKIFNSYKEAMKEANSLKSRLITGYKYDIKIDRLTPPTIHNILAKYTSYSLQLSDLDKYNIIENIQSVYNYKLIKIGDDYIEYEYTCEVDGYYIRCDITINNNWKKTISNYRLVDTMSD